MGKDRTGSQVRPYTPLGPAEQAFLRDCARPEPVAFDESTSLDWSALSIRLVSDGIAPLAYQQFKDRPDTLPAAVFEKIKNIYYQNASANHIRLEELKRIGQCLGRANIPLLVLKGGALAQTVYADPALRFMGDIDVAVPPEQTRPALDILQAEGYALDDASLGANLDDPQLLQEKGWHLILSKQVWGKRMLLEFHWPLRRQVLVSQSAALDVQVMWDTAVPLDEAHNLWQPAPPMMLLHLCLHAGQQHRFTDLGLRHYVDLDRLVRQYQDDPAFWTAFATLARRAGAQHTAYFCLALTRTLFATPLPAGALAPLQPPDWKKNLFHRSLRESDVLNRTRALYAGRRWRWRLLTSDRMSQLVTAPWHTLFPGRDYLASYYATRNRWQLAGYALYHPFHALHRAVRRRLQGRLGPARPVQRVTGP